MSQTYGQIYGLRYEVLAKNLFKDKADDYSGKSYDMLGKDKRVLFRFWRKNITGSSPPDIKLFISPPEQKGKTVAAVVAFTPDGRLEIFLGNIADREGANLAQQFMPEGVVLSWYNKNSATAGVERFGGRPDNKLFDLHEKHFGGRPDVYALLDLFNTWKAAERKPNPTR